MVGGGGDEGGGYAKSGVSMTGWGGVEAEEAVQRVGSGGSVPWE